VELQHWVCASSVAVLVCVHNTRILDWMCGCVQAQAWIVVSRPDVACQGPLLSKFPLLLQAARRGHVACGSGVVINKRCQGIQRATQTLAELHSWSFCMEPSGTCTCMQLQVLVGVAHAW
jgi:hypothetical protein